MKAPEERSYLAGCLALLLVAGAGTWLVTSNPEAGRRGDRAAALRDACIARGRAEYRESHAGADMARDAAAELVARCFSEARRQTE